jgi:hypothetical protein
MVRRRRHLTAMRGPTGLWRRLAAEKGGHVSPTSTPHTQASVAPASSRCAIPPSEAASAPCWLERDRLWRPMRDLLDITNTAAKRVRIETATLGEIDLSTADGVMTARRIATVAQHESARKASCLPSRDARFRPARAAETALAKTQPPFVIRDGPSRSPGIP